MKVYNGGTGIYDYRSDGTVRSYRERWYHRIKFAFFELLCRLGLWR